MRKFLTVQILLCVFCFLSVFLFTELAVKKLKLEAYPQGMIFGFYFLCALFLTWVIWRFFYRIHFPLQQIFQAVRAYEEGKEQTIILKKSHLRNPLICQLGSALNSLSHQLQRQMSTIAEERNEKIAILESLGEGVLAVDAEMQISYINLVGANMLGVPRSKIVGTCFITLTSKLEQCLLDRCCYLLKKCQEKAIVLTDSLSVAEDKIVYFEVIAAPRARGHGAILILQDKSSHYKVLEMGRDFVANASHELRTPITIIKGFTETLQDLPELPHEIVVDIIEKIVRNCQRMDTLVKNLLTLADLENLPAARLQECDCIALSEACRQVVLAVYPSAEIAIQVHSRCGLQIYASEENIVVYADPDILELAIINILDNAAKYSNPPAKITISISQEEDEVKIAITDCGIGISPADLEHIFERFYRVDKARSRRLGGAGLGLSIVRTIIEKHHGRISVSSKMGEGTTFLICLPSKKEF